MSDENETDGMGDEPSGGTLTPSEEMEAALREAEESIDARKRESAQGGSGNSPDKLMLEALSAELQSLKVEYEARVAELEEQKDKFLRLQAEFENFRRRGAKERQELLQYGHQNLVKDLLVTVDNLDRALDHAEQSAGGDLESLLQGVELVRKGLLDVFGKHGVEAIEAEGSPFDPAVHEAMLQVPDDSVPPNTVLQVMEKGYRLRDRMLRPARVTVSTGTATKD